MTGRTGVLPIWALCFAAGWAQPVDPDARPSVRALWQRLDELARTGIMFGHQDDLAYGVHWKFEPGRSDVAEACGDLPAVFGWDLGELELGRPTNLDGVPFDRMQDWIREVHRMGGVNTVSWHMVNPARDSNSWDTTRAVETILPGGTHHEKFRTWLDRFVVFNQALVVDGEAVPLILRPWHEWNGDWFWWGRSHTTVEEFVSLWQFTIQYLRDRGVHNLLYAFSPDVFKSPDQYLERYPGDDWVDILGFDDYQAVRTGESPARMALVHRIRTVVSLARDRGKIAAFTETGVEGIPMATWFTDVLLPALREGAPEGGLSWVLVWRNALLADKPGHHYGPYAGHPSASDCVQFREDPKIYFLQDLTSTVAGQRSRQ